MNADGITLLKKASVATLFGGREKILEAVMASKEKPVLMFSLEGVAVETRTGKTKQADGKESDWLALVGEFYAVAGDTGEVFATGEAFVPAYIAKMIAGRLANGSVALNIDVFANYDPSSASLYTFDGKLHGVTLDSDRAKALIDRARASNPALPAPAKNA